MSQWSRWLPRASACGRIRLDTFSCVVSASKKSHGASEGRSRTRHLRSRVPHRRSRTAHRQGNTAQIALRGHGSGHQNVLGNWISRLWRVSHRHRRFQTRGFGFRHVSTKFFPLCGTFGRKFPCSRRCFPFSLRCSGGWRIIFPNSLRIPSVFLLWVCSVSLLRFHEIIWFSCKISLAGKCASCAISLVAKLLPLLVFVGVR